MELQGRANPLRKRCALKGPGVGSRMLCLLAPDSQSAQGGENVPHLFLELGFGRGTSTLLLQ
jgi:hypothetical protein